MSLRLEISDFAAEDIALQLAWYQREADAEIAGRYEKSVRATFGQIALHPSLGRRRRFSHEELAGLHSIQVERPFDLFLVFYRWSDEVLTIVRVIHGMRDLPNRLLEAPQEG